MRKLASVAFVAGIFVPAFAFAALPDIPTPFTSFQGLVNVFNAIANVMFTLLMGAAVIFIVVAGFHFLTAGGDANKITSARNMLIYAAVAIAVGALSKAIPAVMQQIISSGGGGGGGGCFPKGTKVRLADGTEKEIQDVKPGDQVLAYNLKTHAAGYEAVTHLLIHPGTPGGYLVLNGQLRITPNHRVWIMNRSLWDRADALRAGDTVIGADGVSIRIATIESVPGSYTVYNLELEGPNHDYFAEGVLVHNVK